MKAELNTVESSPVSASGTGFRTRRDPGEDLDVIAPVKTLDYGMIGLYAGVLFLSAFLLMWVQPLFTKMVLPLLGGSSSVWNTAMMFFQIVLLAGYAYAHVLDRFATPRRQPWIHGLVLLGGLLFLPLAIEQSRTPPTDHSPIFWLIGLLALSVGWPFFALSCVGAIASGLVCQKQESTSERPVFPIRREQLRKPARAARVSIPARAVTQPGRTKPTLDGIIRPVDRSCRYMRAAPPIRCNNQRLDPGEASLNFRDHRLASAAHMDFVGICSVQLAVRCYVVHHYGSRVRSAAMGFATSTLPAVIHFGVQQIPTHST